MDSPEPLVKVHARWPAAPLLTAAIAHGVKGWGAQVLDLLYPPVCATCQAPIFKSEGICVACWHELMPITAPLCPILGLPFDVDMGEGAVSALALSNPPVFNRARSAVHYSKMARQIVSRLKFGDQPELARFCGQMMVGAGADFFETNPVLVPVPLHASRQWRRKFNQATELCRVIGHISGCDIAPLLVRRRKKTPQQVGLSALQRAKNVAGAFEVDVQESAKYAGRRLILVDDVVTTGATVTAVTKVLRRSSFDHIDVLSFARVVIGADLPI